jgi:predicted DNA-binding antitoxin AbrB/MazE fold protein
MTITVEAIYENGVLKLSQPLPLKPHEKVTVTVKPAVSWTDQSAGILRWTGNPAEFEHLAVDPEFDPQESA